MSLSNFPAIGDIVLDPSPKFKDETGEELYDLILCTGAPVVQDFHPDLYAKLPLTSGLGVYTLSTPLGSGSQGSRAILNTPIPFQVGDHFQCDIKMPLGGSDADNTGAITNSFDIWDIGYLEIYHFNGSTPLIDEVDTSGVYPADGDWHTVSSTCTSTGEVLTDFFAYNDQTYTFNGAQIKNIQLSRGGEVIHFWAVGKEEGGELVDSIGGNNATTYNFVPGDWEAGEDQVLLPSMTSPEPVVPYRIVGDWSPVNPRQGQEYPMTSGYPQNIRLLGDELYYETYNETPGENQGWHYEPYPSLTYEELVALRESGSITGYEAVHEITGLDGFFSQNTTFNTPLYWCIRKCTNTQSMFFNASSFVGPAAFQDTHRVTNMDSMFREAASFDSPIHYDCTNVTRLYGFLWDAVSFSKELTLEYPERVTSTEYMLWNAHSFNQPVTMNLQRVENMSYMFWKAQSFNSPVNINCPLAYDLTYMFSDMPAMNSPVTLTCPGAVDMSYMFLDSPLFNSEVTLNTGNVSKMRAMFRNALSFNQDLSGWNVDRVHSYQEFNYNGIIPPEHLPVWVL